MFCLFPPNLMSSTYTDKNNPFSRCTNKHSQLGTFSQPYFNRILSNGLSHNSPAKGWPYRFLSRGTTGSSMLEHDLGHLYVVDESKCLDIPILEFKIILEHPPFLPGYKQILRQLLVLRNQAVWIWYPWLLLQSFVMLMNLVQWILHRALNRLSQYHLGVQLDCCLQFSIFQKTCVHQWGEVNFFALRPCFIDHLFLTSDFRQVPRRNFLQCFPFLVHCWLCCWNFHSLRQRNNFVNQIAML